MKMYNISVVRIHVIIDLLNVIFFCQFMRNLSIFLEDFTNKGFESSEKKSQNHWVMIMKYRLN